jgi:hypothetical protein
LLRDAPRRRTQCAPADLTAGRGELRAEQVIRVPAMDEVDLHAVQVFSNAIQIHVFDMALQP